jgi:16S rRNA (cytosine967-C5)-methyltransferase
MSGASEGRLAATRALVDLETSGGRIDAVLEHHGPSLEGAERRLAWALTLGVERNRLLLDHYLAPHVSRHPRDLDPEVRATLRCAAFQILHMDRIPHRAAVHQAVEVVRALEAERAAGLVNASLRSLVEAPERCGPPPSPWIANSMPRWLLKRMTGYAAAALNREPLLALRPRIDGLTRKLLTVGVTALDAPAHVRETGAVLVQPGDPTRLPGWDEGWFAVQDAASQAVVKLVDARPGERILDACAAPGGKALALGDAVGHEGRVVAMDISSDRLAMMDGELQRTSIRNVEPLVGDVTRRAPGTFDRVLVDAPCSAIGTLRRHPEIRWQRRGGDLAEHTIRQLAILEGASAAVGPGGVLVYAVCSFAPEEGADVARAFLDRHPDFQTRPITDVWGPARTDEGWFASWPHDGPWDAFFASVFART